MPYLKWISDKDLQTCSKKLLSVAQRSMDNSQKNMYKNVIDPFSALFQMAGFDMDAAAWVKAEQARQAQKSFQNHVGDFHQNVLGCVRGWDNLSVGNVVDLKSDTKKIIAEIKNKHNTVTGGSLKNVYDDLESEIMPKSSIYHGYTAYFVNIIPKKATRFNQEFTPSDKATGARKHPNRKIRIIDGASFYELVTGDRDALKDLFNALPNVLNDLLNKSQLTKKEVIDLENYFRRAYG